MNRFSVEQYALSVCLLCVVGLVFAVAEAAYAVVQVYAPDFTMPRADLEYRATVTNDSYWKWLSSFDKQQPRPTDDELARRRSDAHRELLAAHSQSAKGSLLQSLIYIVALSVVLVVHWRLALKFRQLAPPSA
jgi:hypothetical protein